MIRITVWPEAIRFEGHAGYAPAGRDIVCAAVSALYHTLVVNLQDRPGYVQDGTELRCPGAAAQIAFVARGLEAIAAAYPECVRVERGGENL